MTIKRPLLSQLVAIVTGLVVTCGSLALGLFGGGPLLRWVWGPPEGFGEDYTTWQAFAQAVLAQAVFLLPAFAVCGLWMHKFLPDKPRWQLALLIANPLNVLIGYWLYFKLFYTGKDLDVELLYFNASGAILWSCMSLVVLAPVTFEGMRLRGTKGHFRNPLTDRTLPPPQR